MQGTPSERIRRRACLGGLFLAVVALFAATPAAQAVVYQEAGGVVVGEGELFSRRTGAGVDTAWRVAPDEVMASDNAVPIANARGGKYVQVLPDSPPGSSAGGGANNPPSIEYDMSITTPGTYRLFLRWDGDTPNGNADSMFADIVQLKDGGGGAIADHYEYQHGLDQNFATTPWDGSAGFEQNNAGGTPNVAANWNIAAPGTYTLRFSKREDGAAVDAWVLQRSSLDAPTGDGPSPSLLRRDSLTGARTPVADSYVRNNPFNGDNFGASGNLFVKDAGSSQFTRKGYIRFDLTGVNLSDLSNAQLALEVSTNNNGGNDPTPKEYIVNVFGLNDGHPGENWGENTINFDNAPGNAANNGVNTSEATLLGQFLVPAINPALTDEPIFVEFTSNVLDFISKDTNGVATFILARDGSSNNLGFYSKEGAGMAPTLRLFVPAPEPATAVLGLLALAALGGRRRRRA